MTTAVMYILNTLAAHGEQAYIVGGCVRDKLMDRNPHDWDICTSALPSQTEAIFREAGFSVIPTGMKHGTVTVVIDNEPFEVTTFRVDGDYEDGRHPDRVRFVSDVTEDLARRDFTMNAIAYSPATGLIDPFHGAEDIERRIIRCVGNPDQRFEEDALRIMRAIRFSATLGFSIEKTTENSAKEHLSLLDNIARERIREELLKLLSGVVVGPTLMEYSDFITQIIPELKPCVGFQQNNPYHIYDVWEHIVHAVDIAEPDQELRMALLLHDIGKPFCYEEDENHVGHFHGHGKISADIARVVLNRLRFSSEEISRIVQLVAIHDRRIEPTKKAVRRVLNEIGSEQFDQLMKVRKADIAAQNPDPVLLKPRLEKIKTLKTLKAQILEERECFSLKDLAVNGRDLIAAGVKPGPEIGQVLQYLLDRVLEDASLNDKETLLSIAKERTPV